jgi:hypothetical protein
MPITEQPEQPPLSNIRTLATLPAVKSPYAQPTYFSLDANDLGFQYASGEDLGPFRAALVRMAERWVSLLTASRAGEANVPLCCLIPDEENGLKLKAVDAHRVRYEGEYEL